MTGNSNQPKETPCLTLQRVTPTERLLAVIREDIVNHGDDRDRADLEAAERELVERRSRKGGRPPKKKPR